MSLRSWLARVFGAKQAEVALVAAVADDGSGDPALVGDLSPIRAEAVTGALLVREAPGAPGVGGATEATLSALNDKITTATDTPTGNDPGVVVRLVQSGPIETTNVNQAFAGAVPGPTATGQLVRVIPTGSQPESGSVCVFISPDQTAFGVNADATLRARAVGANPGGYLSAVSISPDIRALHVRDPDVSTETTLFALYSRKLEERLTGYGEQRIAARSEIFTFTAGTIEDTEILGFVGTGTHGIDAARRAQYIAVDGTNGQSQALQSNTNYPFPPSVPFAVYGVVQFSDAGVVGQVRRVQVGADDDFLGLQFDGTDVSIEILSALSGVPISIPRIGWLDPLDGTGPSAFDIDWTAPNTIEIVSGVPGANAGFAAINGIKILDLPAYLNVSGVMKRSTKPVRAIIYNTAAASPGAIYVRGFSIYALGNYRLPVRVRSAPASPVTRSMSSVLSPLIAVRVKSTLGGEPYRGFCYPKQLTITNKSSSAILDVILYRNPTSLTGASWADVSPRSGIQVDTSATAADLTNATALYVDVVQSSSARTIDLTAVFEEHLSNLIRNRVDGTSDVIVVMCATSISNSDVRAGFVIDEVPG